MNKRAHLVLAVVVTVMLTALVRAEGVYAAAEEELKVEAATEVITEIKAIPEKGIPPALLDDAYGVAVIPGVIKVGFVVGGRHGKGILVVKQDGGWSDPTFVSITGGSVGWQIGAQSTDVILVFKSKKGVDGVTSGKVTLGADAAVAAGPVGRQASASTDVQLKAEIYSYSRSRGLFAGVALEGAVLQIDHRSNWDFYGEKGITADEIFSGRFSAPDAAERFKEALEAPAPPPAEEAD